MPQILVFGASITQGFWDREGGWADRLKRFLIEKSLSNSDLYYPFFNLGISGDTTEGVLKRFEAETEPRLVEERETIIIFSIGTNDSATVHSKNNFWVVPEKFKENIEKIIKLAKKYSSKIVFLGLASVEESKVSPMPWDTDKSYKNEDIQKYNNIAKSVCEKNDLYFIDMFELLKKEDLEDGVHPNTEGHKKIFGAVKDFLVKNKII